MDAKLRQGLRTWIEIDQSAIKHNYEQFRNNIPDGCKLCAVVKSNAYGHGLAGFSQELVTLGVDWLAVDSITEALRLREEGIVTPILVLGFTLPEMFEQAIKNNISLAISSFDSLNTLAAYEGNFLKKIKIHIKVDSGMHRQGFLDHEMDAVIGFLKAHKDIIQTEGLFTHFAAPKNPAFPDETKQQITLFQQWNNAFRKAVFTVIRHAGASSGALVFPEAHFDMVRIGIGMTGLLPSEEIEDFVKGRLTLKPVLSWKTIISEIKEIPTGSKIGYDFTESVTRKTRMAICPVGYWHGFVRALSSVGCLLVRGKRAKVLGRVSMDMVVIDITDIPEAKFLDEAVIIGTSGKETISATKLAELSGTSQYECITRINPLIKKIHI